MPPIIAAAVAHPIIAAGAAAAIGAGAAKAGGVGQKDGSVDAQFLENPEYPHSQDARDLWWGKLQKWGDDPNYGAIAPDWNDIWEQTQQKVRQYYNGGPMTPGVQDRVNSSLARRGMSENPASDFLHAQVGAQEAQDLGSLSAQKNIAQNQFAETGRQNWLESLQNFQAQRPAGQWNVTTTPPQSNPWIDFVGNTGSAVASAGMQINAGNAQNDILKKLVSPQEQLSFAPAVKSGALSGTVPYDPTGRNYWLNNS